MNCKYLFLLITLFASTFISAQRNNRYTVDPFNSNITYTITSYGITEDEFNEADGSPYFDKEFKPGTIISGDKISKAYLRYNIFFEEIEITQDPGSKDISALRKEQGTKATFDDRVFIYLLLGTGENQTGVYFQILSTGSQFDLYMKSTVRYIPPFYGSTHLQHDKPGKFEITNKFFLVSKAYKFIAIPENHRTLLKLLSYKKKETKNFLKKNKIKLNNEEDVIKFVEYYNKVLKM